MLNIRCNSTMQLNNAKFHVCVASTRIIVMLRIVLYVKVTHYN